MDQARGSALLMVRLREVYAHQQGDLVLCGVALGWGTQELAADRFAAGALQEMCQNRVIPALRTLTGPLCWIVLMSAM